MCRSMIARFLGVVFASAVALVRSSIENRSMVVFDADDPPAPNSIARNWW